MAQRHGGWRIEKPFDEQAQCWGCKLTFNLFNRRHHCRYCKHSFCTGCSNFFSPIPDLQIKELVRVCGPCRDVIKGTRTQVWPDDETENHEFMFDMFVIGGGSGGLACAKESAKLGKRVGLCDFVKPSPQNTTWGLGGTCVNVGCIPKKLMHQASLLGEHTRDSQSYGWDVEQRQHSWEKLVAGVQAYIRSLNTGYENQLELAGIKYYNAFGRFKSKNAVALKFADGREEIVTARRIVIAVGGRPKQLDIPGWEHCITSDDIFSMKRNPGKDVLVVGASYVALECAGFLTGLGHNVSVGVRSVLLRGFDQEVAEKIGLYMAKMGTKFLRQFVPTRIVKHEGDAPKLQVFFNVQGTDEEQSEFYDTVLVAVGREVVTKELQLCCAGVMRNVSGKLPVFQEQTNVANIYAIGDVAAVDGSLALELTPVAIQAGRLLARRLYANSKVTMDYCFVPTTIFTPLEYGCIGLTEEDARERLGNEGVEVFHQVFQPLEMSLPNRMNKDDACYVKLVIDLKSNNRVIGFHFLGPNAGEVTQGFAVAMRNGATKEDFDATVGIHPTSAETVVTLEVSKGSGLSAVKEDC